jgi:two-component system, OmpR family, phosphate regulon sensor histidine kinase PhoR
VCSSDLIEFFDISLPLPATEELDGLAYTLNKMAAQLNDRIRTATKQGNEQQAILSSMIEGVIAVDIDENIIIMNQTAGSMLRVSTESIQGKWIFEVIRNTDIRRFIQKTLASDISIEGEIVLLSPQGKERYLQTHGTVLVNSTGVSIGVLVVLHDVTRLKKLENVRREFVANVSHELRTPLTSIKGFVETLVDGAIHDPEGAKRFLNIIINHVNRLNAIVEDLLTISRIEKESETREIQLETTSIRSIITAAVNVCEQKAKERAVTLNVTCDGSLYIIANRFLLEQAIINLVDNAIKYSENESVVSVDVQERNKEIVISVSDNGCGISPEHVPRLFERFYRIDKARSRKQGGTGLGLSIVKHTVLAHGGRVDVKSTVGKGSTFFIYLKAQRDAPVKTSGDLTNHGTPATPYAP